MKSQPLKIACVLLMCGLACSAFALNGDPRPDAPELAARGSYAVGVRTMNVVHRDQLNILAASATDSNPRYDRPLRLEVWYPAQLQSGQAELNTYTDVLGAGANNPARPNTPFTFEGRAARDAQPLTDKPFPLVIVSHGYPGSRLQMSYLTELSSPPTVMWWWPLITASRPAPTKPDLPAPYSIVHWTSCSCWSRSANGRRGAAAIHWRARSTSARPRCWVIPWAATGC